jgi:hypothetical protein
MGRPYSYFRHKWNVIKAKGRNMRSGDIYGRRKYENGETTRVEGEERK